MIQTRLVEDSKAMPWSVTGRGPTRAMLEGLSRSCGSEYFLTLVREVARSVGVEYAFVAEVVARDPLRARTISAWKDGSFVESMEYELDGTPCLELFTESFICYPSGVRGCFPEDQLFVDWRVESYAGARLTDDDGNLLGWVGVMSRRPFVDAWLVQSVVSFIAERTSSELQRKREEEELRARNERLSLCLSTRARELEEANARLRSHIDQRCEMERQLVESKERYELASRGAKDGIWEWKSGSEELHVSDRWMDIVGWSDPSRRPGWSDVLELIHPTERDELRTIIGRHWKGEKDAFEAEFRLNTSCDTERWVLARGAVIRDESGDVVRFAGSLSDITLRKKNEQRLVHEATHDHLTGLANRALFLDRVQHAIALNARQHVYDFAVLFVDLDRFKIVNDSLGHQSGDVLLCEVTRRIEGAIRPVDLVARLGGDEFAVLLENVDGPRDTTIVCDRILAALAKPVVVEGHELYPGASIGIALSTTGYESAVDMIRDADTAMYRAKDGGRGRYEIFDSRMHFAAVKRLQMESDIRRAIDRDELRLAYQPVISTSTGELDGFEALLRWEHPTKGLVMPNEFIPIAEETGLIAQLGAWVVHAACRQLSEWHRTVDRPVALSLNVSTLELQDLELVQRLETLVSTHRIDGMKLRLEITESAMMVDAETAMTTFGRLRDLGLEVSIDDFGTGYSSLAWLAQFPIDILKIDRSFVSSMDRDSLSEELVRMIVGLAHNLRAKVVAEGVETLAQLENLIALDCDFVQGYLFSRPVPVETATRMLHDRSGYAGLVERARGSR